MNIPRVMSFFWTKTRMSWMRYMTLYSFRAFNPDWEMVLYSCDSPRAKTWNTPEEEDVETYQGEDWTKSIDDLHVRCEQWVPPIQNLSAAHMSGLCGWDTLANRGGFISDMDILFVRPMDSVYDASKDAEAVFFLTLGYSANGFLASMPGCRLFSDIYKEAVRGHNPSAYQCVGPEVIYRMAGQGHNWCTTDSPGAKSIECLRSLYGDVHLIVMPESSVYPWNYKETSNIFDRVAVVPSTTIGIHWFGGLANSQQWNRLLTERNLGKYDNTFMHYARRVLQLNLNSPGEFGYMMEI